MTFWRRLRVECERFGLDPDRYVDYVPAKSEILEFKKFVEEQSKNIKNLAFVPVLSGTLPYGVLLKRMGYEVFYVEAHAPRWAFLKDVDKFGGRKIKEKIVCVYESKEYPGIIVFYNRVPKDRNLMILEDVIETGHNAIFLKTFLEKMRNNVYINARYGIEKRGQWLDGLICTS